MPGPPVDRWTIGSLLETASGYLREKGSSSPRLDAELLLAEALRFERIQLYTQYDRPLAAEEVDAYRALVARRAAHEPVAYILSRAYFRHLCLEVGPEVLIPRPETEELVEAALALLRRRPPWGATTETSPPLVADVGTGSGAIALSIAQEAGVTVLATDQSAEALALAARNAGAAGLEGSVTFARTDLLATVPDGSLHMVVSNPPYVTTEEMDRLAPDIRLFEPVSALDAGPDGLSVIRRLLPEVARVLRPGGSMLMEVGAGQAAVVQQCTQKAGFAFTRVHKDLSQKDRIVEATMPGAAVLSVAGLEEAALTSLAGALDAGAVIGVPTDTVYGIAARWDSPAGVRALFEAKGRSGAQPVAVAFASVQALESVLTDLDPAALRVMEALLPGPYTFVVATAVTRPSQVGTADSLGVRVPDRPDLLRLLGLLRSPLALTSANRTGEGDAKDLADADAGLLSRCSAAFGSSEGSTGGGSASTVVDLRPLRTGGAPVVLREGAVAAATVLERIAAL